MITDKEKQATLLSPTKKDFFQIWNELLELASKISDRWTPTETNESDPGIVLLKLLTGCADKLNYTVDKNILEAFMPSAAQEESMRKLCDMMGYNMKYYRSATTKVTITFNNDADVLFQSAEKEGIVELILPKYTNLTNVDNSINYVTLSQIAFTKNILSNSVECIEGSLTYCNEDNNRIVTMNNIDDDFRYYLPQSNIAENGIFIYNVKDSKQSSAWKQVDNLNTLELETKCFKFGYDSKEQLPYIQFPEDLGSIIGDGLVIGYIVTNGINGNVNAKTICSFDAPADWGSADDSDYNHTGVIHSVNEFTCYNINAANNGADKESLNEAYNGFKKTIGTFDTLVTCRDYMNKIYQLTKSENDTTPIVSNNVVADIRDDINKAITICSFNEFGICYVDTPVTEMVDRDVHPKDDPTKTVTISERSSLIDNFDIMLYPFKTVYGLNTKSEHDNSFKYDKTVYNTIVEDLEDYKTISHNLTLPTEDPNYPKNNSEIVAIKNYLKLNARLTTTAKVNSIEQAAIINNIKTALYTDFNLRKLDFGDEIPFDTILECIENADTRIKNVSLDEPVLYTRFLLADNSEYDTAAIYEGDSSDKELIKKANNQAKNMMCANELSAYNKTENQKEYRKNRKLQAREIYNKLALRNVIAGRVSLFNYDTQFVPSVTESKHEDTPLIIPDNDTDVISSISGDLKIENIPKEADESTNITLLDNQIIQFRAPNFRTTMTYPAYVNYYAKLNTSKLVDQGCPATMLRLRDFMTEEIYKVQTSKDYGTNFEIFMNDKNIVCCHGQSTYMQQIKYIHDYYQAFTKYGCVFLYNDSTKKFNKVTEPEIKDEETGELKHTYEVIKLSKDTYGKWFSWVKAQSVKKGSVTEKLNGIYKNLGADQSREIGNMVDNNKNKYQLDYTGYYASDAADSMTYYFVQEIHEADVPGENGHTTDGLGKDTEYNGIAANTEYQLSKGEYLCLNYTNAENSVDTSAIDEGGETTLTTTSSVINVYYGPGTIIRPSFELKNSDDMRRSGKVYAKTDGYEFRADLGAQWKKQVPGMFSLGADDQIEIRELVKVQVYDNTEPSKVYVYFIVNEEKKAKAGDTIQFLLDGESRVLQEGEYFWYTDKNKTTLTYCGDGCEIFNKTGKPITKNYDLGEITVEDIEEKGINAVNWITLTNLNYKKDGVNVKNTEKYIEWQEYQYITLTTNDTLCNTTRDILTNKWEKIPNDIAGKTTYKLSGETTTHDLPVIKVTTSEGSETIDVDWYARTKLAINMSAASQQTLHNCSYGNGSEPEPGTIVPSCTETVTVKYNNKEETTTLQSSEDSALSLKSNYTINDTVDEIYTSYVVDDDDTATVKDFKLKAFTYNDIKYKENTENAETLSLNNMGSYYTSIPFSGSKQGEKFSTLHCVLPNDEEYGIIMFYYVTLTESSTLTDYVSIKLVNKGTSDLKDPAIFNNRTDTNPNDVWWDDKIQDGKFYFKPNAVNVVKIYNSVDIEIYAGASERDNLVFSPLRLVKFNTEEIEGQIYSDDGLNFDLLGCEASDDLNNASKVKLAKEILSGLSKLDPDHTFFYNCIIDPSTEVGINTYANETLATPKIWYDYNNVNNKFVISEIDTDYLDYGLTFSSSSTKLV